MKHKMTSRKRKVIGSIVGAAILICIAFFITCCLVKRNEAVTEEKASDNESVAYGNGFVLESSTGTAKQNLSAPKYSLVVEDGYTEEAPATNEDLIKWRDEQINRILEENNLTAYDLENYADKIESSIMARLQAVINRYEQATVDPIVIRGEDGKDGRDGKDGIQGATGSRGPAGATGATGKTGQTGQTGQPGIQGIQGVQGIPGERGESGEDGKSTYIAYAEDDKGTGFSKAPTENTKYIGTCITTEPVAPTDPTKYTWQQYKEYIITFDDVTDTLIIR